MWRYLPVKHRCQPRGVFAVWVLFVFLTCSCFLDISLCSWLETCSFLWIIPVALMSDSDVESTLSGLWHAKPTSRNRCRQADWSNALRHFTSPCFFSLNTSQRQHVTAGWRPTLPWEEIYSALSLRHTKEKPVGQNRRTGPSSSHLVNMLCCVSTAQNTNCEYKYDSSYIYGNSCYCHCNFCFAYTGIVNSSSRGIQFLYLCKSTTATM